MVRRVKIVLGVLAVLVLLIASAVPAMARDNDNGSYWGNGDNNGWSDYGNSNWSDYPSWDSSYYYPSWGSNNGWGDYYDSGWGY